MKWKKETPISDDDLHIGCLNCSTDCLEAPMSMIIVVGFGHAYVTKNGKLFYDGEKDYDENGIAKTVGEIEEVAKLDPDNDWRIVKYAPLHGETFQRQDGKWVCIESNMGFA